MTCNFEQGDKAIIVWEVLTGQMLRAFPMATTTLAGEKLELVSCLCSNLIQINGADHYIAVCLCFGLFTSIPALLNQASAPSIVWLRLIFPTESTPDPKIFADRQDTTGSQ